MVSPHGGRGGSGATHTTAASTGRRHAVNIRNPSGGRTRATMMALCNPHGQSATASRTAVRRSLSRRLPHRTRAQESVRPLRWSENSLSAGGRPMACSPRRLGSRREWRPAGRGRPGDGQATPAGANTDGRGWTLADHPASRSWVCVPSRNRPSAARYRARSRAAATLALGGVGWARPSEPRFCATREDSCGLASIREADE
jgi:hypothetical protein